MDALLEYNKHICTRFCCSVFVTCTAEKEDSAWLRNRLRIVAIATTLLEVPKLVVEVPQPFLAIATTVWALHTAVRQGAQYGKGEERGAEIACDVKRTTGATALWY